MEQEVLLNCRQALLAKQAELLPRVLKRTGIQIEKSTDEVDDIVESGERELAVTHIKRDAGLLKMILTALAKIDTGEFGVCDNCGQAITAKRLAATPWATHCMPCAELIENECAGTSGKNVFRVDLKALEGRGNRTEGVMTYTPMPVNAVRPAPNSVFDRIVSQSQYHGGLYPSQAYLLLSQDNHTPGTRGRKHHKEK